MLVVARMTSDRQPSNSYEYLRTLRPEARAMQAAELERGVLAGEESPRNALILQELRRTIPRAPPPAARMGEVARMFLRRSSRSVNDDAVDQKRAGRIARVSLEPVWGGCRRRSRRRAPISNARFPPTTGSKPNSAPHTARSRHSSHPRGDGVGDRGRQGAPQARRAGRHAACARGSGDAVRHLGQSRLAQRTGAPIAQPLAQVRARADRFGEALVGIGDRAEGAERGGHRQRRRLSPRLYFNHGPVGDAVAPYSPRHPRGRHG